MVVCGVREPETFVRGNDARERLESKGVRVVYVEGLEQEILEVARAGHRRVEGVVEPEKGMDMASSG